MAKRIALITGAESGIGRAGSIDASNGRLAHGRRRQTHGPTSDNSGLGQWRGATRLRLRAT